MAPKVIDYSKSVIYKIEHVDNPELLYVGSTTDFIRRKSEHKRRCKNENGKQYNSKLYQLIRDNGNFDNFKCIVIKEYPCNSKIELIIEEEKYRKELQANLNLNKAYVNIEEKRANQKYSDIIYREKHKEKIKEKMTCDCGSIFRILDKSKHYKTLKHINFINN